MVALREPVGCQFTVATIIDGVRAARLMLWVPPN